MQNVMLRLKLQTNVMPHVVHHRFTLPSSYVKKKCVFVYIHIYLFFSLHYSHIGAINL